MAGQGEVEPHYRRGTVLLFVSQAFLMNECDYRRLRATAFWSLVGFVAMLACGASRADATCGDWLAHAGEMPALHTGETVDEKKSRDPSSTSQRDRSRSLPVSKPCHGPFCRSAPSQPAPTSPANAFPQIEKLALFGEAVLNLTQCGQLIFGDEANAHPLRGFPALIDHPPRS
jgi:hypothetical protein